MSPAKTALLVIDVQRAILALPNLNRKQEIEQAFDATVRRIAALIERARTAGVPVIFVQHNGGPGHRLAPGRPGWSFRPEIEPRAGELIVHKSACDAFFDTTLQAELSAAGITQLVVTGCMTQYCIDTTVRRAVSLGYEVALVADGHMTVDSDTLTFEQIIAHHNALLDGFDAGGCEVRVCPSSEVHWTVI